MSPPDLTRIANARAKQRRTIRKLIDGLAPLGVTLETHDVLLSIATHPDPLGPTIKDLAARLAIGHNTTVVHVQNVERGGLLRRSADPSDLRAVRLRLTTKGEQALKKVKEMYAVVS